MNETRKADAASPSAVGIQELQVRIRCRGKMASVTLDEVRLGLEEAKALGRDPLLVFEDLGLLQDSVSSLIKGLCRLLVGYARAVTFWESSGFTEAFLSVMEVSPGSDQAEL